MHHGFCKMALMRILIVAGASGFSRPKIGVAEMNAVFVNDVSQHRRIFVA